ncbi:jg20830, partial [Pararge aegeria aegeria]
LDLLYQELMLCWHLGETARDPQIRDPPVNFSCPIPYLKHLNYVESQEYQS